VQRIYVSDRNIYAVGRINWGFVFEDKKPFSKAIKPYPSLPTNANRADKTRLFQDSDFGTAANDRGQPFTHLRIVDRSGRIYSILGRLRGWHEMLAETIYMVAAHPSYHAPLREEIQSLVQNYGLNRHTLQKMEKLDSFIKETFRLKPLGFSLCTGTPSK
jgi:Cytochrome P450